MNRDAMNKKIQLLLDGETIKLRCGGSNALISERTQSQLFNALHRDHKAHSMILRRIDDDLSLVSIVVYGFDRNVLIDSKIITY